jgi:hypothetical protein
MAKKKKASLYAVADMYFEGIAKVWEDVLLKNGLVSADKAEEAGRGFAGLTRILAKGQDEIDARREAGEVIKD